MPPSYLLNIIRKFDIYLIDSLSKLAPRITVQTGQNKIEFKYIPLRMQFTGIAQIPLNLDKFPNKDPLMASLFTDSECSDIKSSEKTAWIDPSIRYDSNIL